METLFGGNMQAHFYRPVSILTHAHKAIPGVASLTSTRVPKLADLGFKVVAYSMWLVTQVIVLAFVDI